MPRIAPAIFPSHVDDQGIRMFTLHLQGRDQRVFALDHDMMRFAFHLEADSEYSGPRLVRQLPDRALASAPVGEPTAIGSLAGKLISIA
jgi:hypothetical protein